MELGTSILGILGIIAFIWIVIDVWTKQHSMTTGMKVLWTILGFFFSIITAIVYYFIVFKK